MDALRKARREHLEASLTMKQAESARLNFGAMKKRNLQGSEPPKKRLKGPASS